MSYKNKLVLLAATALPFSSMGSTAFAETVTITPDLKDFNRVELRAAADVDITVGENYSVTISGDEDMIEEIEVIVRRGRLIIKRKNEDDRRFFNWSSEGYMEAVITMPTIEGMEINGAGDTIIRGVDSDELELSINGSGNLDVSGKTNSLDASINGSGDIDMGEVTGGDIEASINGSGDIDIAGGTCQSIEIKINGSGNVDARQVECQDAEVNVSGSGDSIVYASNQIVFDSHGSGEVEVYGKPKTVIDKEAKRRSKINIH